MKRHKTQPPVGAWGWAKEILALAFTVAAIGALSYGVHVFRMRKSVAKVEAADCTGAVVFVEGDQRWRYDAGPDCERFRVGDRWQISWNMNGLVEPVRRR